MAEIIYPFKKYNYKVLIDQSEEAGFSEVSSPDITADPIEYREGNMAGKTPGKQPGILKYSNVTLKRGTTDSQVFRGDRHKTEWSGCPRRSPLPSGAWGPSGNCPAPFPRTLHRCRAATWIARDLAVPVGDIQAVGGGQSLKQICLNHIHHRFRVRQALFYNAPRPLQADGLSRVHTIVSGEHFIIVCRVSENAADDQWHEYPVLPDAFHHI